MTDFLISGTVGRLYYLTVFAVAMWVAVRTARLTRLLLWPSAKRLPTSDVTDGAASAEDAARGVLAGKVSVPAAAASLGRLGGVEAKVAYLAAGCERAIRSLWGLVWLTVIITALSVSIDLMPALDRELSGQAMTGSRALYLVAGRLVTRISLGLGTSAAMTVICIAFESILRRRCAEWELLAASRRIGGQELEKSSTVGPLSSPK
jgi:hypothetical protein